MRGTADTSQEAGKPGSGCLTHRCGLCPALPSSPLHPIGAFPASGLGWSLDCQEQGLHRMCPCPSPCDSCDESRSKGPMSCRRVSGEAGITVAMMTRDSRQGSAFVTQDRGEGQSGVQPCSLAPCGSTGPGSSPHSLIILDPSLVRRLVISVTQLITNHSHRESRVMGMCEESLPCTPASTHHCPDPACDLTSAGSGLCSHLCY